MELKSDLIYVLTLHSIQNNNEKTIEVINQQYKVDPTFFSSNTKNVIALDNLENSSIKTIFSKSSFQNNIKSLLNMQVIKCISNADLDKYKITSNQKNNPQYLMYSKLDNISIFIDFNLVLFVIEFFDINVSSLIEGIDEQPQQNEAHVQEKSLPQILFKNFVSEKFEINLNFISASAPTLESIKEMKIESINISSFKDLKIQINELILKNSTLTQLIQNIQILFDNVKEQLL